MNLDYIRKAIQQVKEKYPRTHYFIGSGTWDEELNAIGVIGSKYGSLIFDGYTRIQLRFKAPRLVFDGEVDMRIDDIAKCFGMRMKKPSSNLYRSLKKNALKEVASLWSDMLFIDPNYEKADELLERIDSEIYSKLFPIS